MPTIQDVRDQIAAQLELSSADMAVIDVQVLSRVERDGGYPTWNVRRTDNESSNIPAYVRTTNVHYVPDTGEYYFGTGMHTIEAREILGFGPVLPWWKTKAGWRAWLSELRVALASR